MAETASYLLAGFILVISYFVGNVATGAILGLTGTFSGWIGPLEALLQTIGGLVLYASVTVRVTALAPRHVGVPPIINATIGATIVGVSYLAAGGLPAGGDGGIWAFASFVISALGWSLFGFVKLAETA